MSHVQLNILYVCSGNICRSPMAEYVTRHLVPSRYVEKFNVRSAGIYGFVDQPVPTQIIDILDKYDIDIRPHRSQGLSIPLLQEAHIVFAMSEQHRRYLASHFPQIHNKLFLLGGFLQDDINPEKHSIADPYGGSLRMYEKIYKRIYKEVERILPYMLQLIDEYDK